VIRNNIILGANSDGIAMQPHQSGSPSNLVVVHNTVLDADGAALSLRSATGTVVIANNALYTSSGTALFTSGALDQVTIGGNVIQGSINGPGGLTATGDLAADFVAASFSGTPPNDVFPAEGGGLVGAGDVEHVVADDFNGAGRGGVADVGAYAFASSGNPGWTLTDGPKSSVPEPADAGSSGGASGTGGASGGSPGMPSMGDDAGGGDGGSVGGPLDDGGVAGPATSGDDSGCGCKLASRGGDHSMALLFALALPILRRLRQRPALLHRPSDE
jgi:hypothetical protein